MASWLHGLITLRFCHHVFTVGGGGVLCLPVHKIKTTSYLCYNNSPEQAAVNSMWVHNFESMCTGGPHPVICQTCLIPSPARIPKKSKLNVIPAVAQYVQQQQIHFGGGIDSHLPIVQFLRGSRKYLRQIHRCKGMIVIRHEMQKQQQQKQQ